MPHALQFLVLTLAGWLNRHQEDLIDYLREENRILRVQLGSQPLRLTDAQRRRLAVRGSRPRPPRAWIADAKQSFQDKVSCFSSAGTIALRAAERRRAPAVNDRT